MANYKKYFENLPKLAYHSRVLVLANIEPSSHHCFFCVLHPWYLNFGTRIRVQNNGKHAQFLKKLARSVGFDRNFNSHGLFGRGDIWWPKHSAQ